MKGSVTKRGNRWVVRYWDARTKTGIYRRFRNENDAQIFWAALNVQKHEGKLDARDYSKENPLGFSTQAKRWLDYRQGTIRDIRHLRSHMARAEAFFGNRNVKEIGYAELDDFLQALPQSLSGKTKANLFTTLHSFWTWVFKREKARGFTIPDFPEISFTLGWRTTVDKDTQERIIEEVRRISYRINPKIWIGIKWLSTYVAIRPGELIQIQEGDFDISLGVVNVRKNKENKPKIVPLLEEDIDIVRSFPPAMPHVYFFRHGTRKGLSVQKRKQFGRDYLYDWWRKACHNLGIAGVDLYGGTRHSSVKALRERFSPEEIKRGTMHATNSAFERYFQIELEDSRKIYRATHQQKGKVISFRKEEKS